MRTKGSKNYLLVILTMGLAFNQVDRQALGLVLQQIKGDFHLSDTQLGLLSGMAFALFYAVMGLPLARWADRGNRVLIIGLTSAIWSILVMSTGLAADFVQLILIRIGVAVGEAGFLPSAYSLIASYFDRSERPRAVAIYLMGPSLSVIVGYFAGGWLDTRYGWKIMFIALGFPGLLISALAVLYLKEPRNSHFVSKNSDLETVYKTVNHQKFLKVISNLLSCPSFRNLLMSISVASFFNFGILTWIPTYFIRQFGLNTMILGAWLAFLMGLVGIVASYAGGELATRYAASNEQMQLAVMATLQVAMGLILVFVYLSPNLYVAFGLLGLVSIGGCVANGPLFATIQTLVPEDMRAVSVALIYLFVNLIGMGLGPLAVGVLSDALRRSFGHESLRYALIFMCPGYLWVTWHMWRASRTVMKDIEATMVPTPAVTTL